MCRRALLCAALLLVATTLGAQGRELSQVGAPSMAMAPQESMAPAPAPAAEGAALDAAGGTMPAGSGTPLYTMADVELNNGKGGAPAWTVINSQVYDVTSWVDQHPGGPERILGLAGKDGTAQFTAQHGPVGYEGEPQMILKTFLLGPLDAAA